MGDVTNVVLFDKEPDGVASVRYGNAVAANECVKVRSSSTHLSVALEITCKAQAKTRIELTLFSELRL